MTPVEQAVRRITELEAECSAVGQDRSVLSDMVARLTDEKQQDANIIMYWKDQYMRRQNDYSTLYGQCEDIKESYRDCASTLHAANRHIAHLANERDEHRNVGQVMFERQQRWQEMAEELWEELSEWHADTCPHHTAYALKEPGECTCHRILAAKWNDLLEGDNFTDDEVDA